MGSMWSCEFFAYFPEMKAGLSDHCVWETCLLTTLTTMCLLIRIFVLKTNIIFLLQHVLHPWLSSIKDQLNANKFWNMGFV
jgi:hypothetical protein